MTPAPRRAAAAALLFSLPLALARAEDASALLDAAIESSKAISAYVCAVKSESVVGSQRMETYGTIAFLAPGYFKMSSTMTGGESISKTLLVTDGKTSYVQTEAEDGKPPYVVKSDRAPGATPGLASGSPTESLEQFKLLYDFEIDPQLDGMPLNGQAMRILKGKLRAGEIAKLAAERGMNTPGESAKLLEKMMAYCRIWLGGTDRFLYRIELIPEDIKPGAARGLSAYPRTTTTFAEVDLKAKLSPSDFKYVPPKGASVEDLGRSK